MIRREVSAPMSNVSVAKVNTDLESSVEFWMEMISSSSLVEFSDGSMSAFFRSSKRIRRSDSSDGGVTWSDLAMTELPHPGAGIEAIMLRNGHLLMIYNDREDARDRLAVSISTDGGQTWKWTRHLEDTSGGRFDYPSIIQAKDNTLHATYGYNLNTIKHVRFSEAWIQRRES